MWPKQGILVGRTKKKRVYKTSLFQVTLSESQTNKLRADLAVVDGNMTVMNDMLNELTTQPHTAHHDSDIELLNVSTCIIYFRNA